MIFATGLYAPETPRRMSDDTWLVVEMAPPGGGVAHISRDGSTIRRIAETGTPNGLTINSEDRIFVAETHPRPGLFEVTMGGAVIELANAAGDDSFLLPNDLCFGPDGAMYMTDSGITMAEWAPDGSVRPDWQTADFDGKVYRIEAEASMISVLDRGLRFANGIAFGPDGLLYVNEMITGNIYRYDLSSSSPKRELFANVLSPEWDAGFRGPDGMSFGSNGKLFCAVYGQGDVTVIAESGAVTSRISTTGGNPTNVGFGPHGQRRIYVTEHELGQIEMYDVDTDGLPLHDGWL